MTEKEKLDICWEIITEYINETEKPFKKPLLDFIGFINIKKLLLTK